MFTEIDATEYLDDLWGRDGPHMHIYITKFEEVIISCFTYVCMYMHLNCNGICDWIFENRP